MSKHVKESLDPLRRETRNPKNRIPNLEWLFGYGESKKKRKVGFLRKLISRDWKSLTYSTLIYLLQALPVFVMPLVTSDVIDMVTYRPEGYLLRIVLDGVLLALVIMQNVPTTMWRSRIVNNWIRNTSAEIKSGVIRKLSRLSITYHKEIEEGKIQSKLLRDVESIETYYRVFLSSFIPSLVGAVISTIIAVIKSPIVTLFFAVIVPLNLLVARAFRKKIKNDNRFYREENEKLSSKLTTTLQMLTLIKAHGLIATEEIAVSQRIHSVTQAGLKLDKLIACFGSMMWVVSQILSASCLFFCVALALHDIISLGEVVLFQSLFSSINGSVSALVNIIPTLISGEEAVHSLSEIICAEELEREGGKQVLDELQGNVDFDHIFYRYPGDSKDVVKDFDLHVKQGERIAIVGASGSGKSTVINLIIGLLSPTEGAIRIDGMLMDELPMQEYRRYIAVVPQNSILFSGSIRENITYGLDHYSEEALSKAVENANINEFLPSFSEGLNSQVGEHGDKLSGGQKQRISIARALLRDPKILILDEATSALDNLSEYHVQKAIDTLIKGRTTFIVAHRLSTIRNADRIVVMDDGKIVEQGTYEELIALGGKFSELDRLSRIRETENEKMVAGI